MDLIVILILICGIGFFGLSLTFKSLRIRLRDSIFLTINAICATIFGLCFIIMFYLLWLGDEGLFLLFQKIALLPFLTICISGYYYHEAFVGVRPPMRRMSVFLIFYTFILSFIIINIADLFKSEKMNAFTIMITFAYSVFFHSFASWVHARIYKMWARKSVRLDFICTVSVVISSAFVSIAFGLEYFDILEHFSLLQLWILGVAMVVMSFGIGVLALNNLKVGDYIYFIPVPIHMILIYNHGGVLAYSRNVFTHSSNFFQISEILVSGGLSGFSSFFKEVLGANANLNHINATNFEFLFNNLSNGIGTMVLITSGNNFFLKKSMERFNAMIDSSIQKMIYDCSRLEELEKNLDDIVVKAFPYITLGSKQIKKDD